MKGIEKKRVHKDRIFTTRVFTRSKFSDEHLRLLLKSWHAAGNGRAGEVSGDEERILQYLGQLSDGNQMEDMQSQPTIERLQDGVPYVSEADTESLTTLSCHLCYSED